LHIAQVTHDLFDRPLVGNGTPPQRLFAKVPEQIVQLIGKRLQVPEQSILIPLIHRFPQSRLREWTTRSMGMFSFLAPVLPVLLVVHLRHACQSVLKDARLTDESARRKVQNSALSLPPGKLRLELLTMILGRLTDEVLNQGDSRGPRAGSLDRRGERAD